MQAVRRKEEPLPDQEKGEVLEPADQGLKSRQAIHKIHNLQRSNKKHRNDRK